MTQKTRKALYAALLDAQAGGAMEVSSEHLLVALTQDPEAVACRVLERLGVSREGLREDLEQLLPQASRAGPPAEWRLTQEALRAVNLGNEELPGPAEHGLTTGHLLAGVLAEGTTPAARALAERGVTLEEVRGVIRALQPLEWQKDDEPTPAEQ